MPLLELKANSSSWFWPDQFFSARYFWRRAEINENRVWPLMFEQRQKQFASRVTFLRHISMKSQPSATVRLQHSSRNARTVCYRTAYTPGGLRQGFMRALISGDTVFVYSKSLGFICLFSQCRYLEGEQMVTHYLKCKTVNRIVPTVAWEVVTTKIIPGEQFCDMLQAIFAQPNERVGTTLGEVERSSRRRLLVALLEVIGSWRQMLPCRIWSLSCQRSELVASVLILGPWSVWSHRFQLTVFHFSK